MPPLRPPEGRQDLIPLVLFPNQGRGFGFGSTRRGMGEELAEGYERTLDMQVRAGNAFAPFFAPLATYYWPSQDRSGFLVTWSDHLGNLLLFPVRGQDGSRIIRVQDRMITWEDGATTAEFGSATFYDDGTGASFLYAGTVTGSRLLNRRSFGGIWAQDDDVVALHVVEAAGALWAASSEYEVRKCPAGSDPFVLANWGAAVRVGTTDARILRLGRIGPAPVVFKEDGIYIFDEIEARFANRYPVPRDRDNFPFVADDGQGGLLSASYDGTIVWMRLNGSIVSIHPLAQAWPGPLTPQGPIRDMAVLGGRWFALMDAPARSRQPPGMVVLYTADFQNYQDLTFGVTDGMNSTAAQLGGMTASHSLLIGFDAHFLAVDFQLTNVNINPATFDTVGLSTGGTDTGATWTTSYDFWDGTAARGLSAGAIMSFGLPSGRIALRPTTPTDEWAKATLNGQTKYWMRLSPSAAFSTPVSVADMAIVPRRSAPPLGPNAVWEASGLMPKLLAGSLSRTRDTVVWEDVATIQSVAPASRLAVGNVSIVAPYGRLLALTQDRLVVYPEPALPRLSPPPYAALAHEYEPGSVLYPPVVDLAGGTYRLEYVECWGQGFSASDGWQVAFRWGDTLPWTVSSLVKGPYARFDFTAQPNNAGTRLSTAIVLRRDGNGPSAQAPEGSLVVAWLKPLAERPRAQLAAGRPEEV